MSFTNASADPGSYVGGQPTWCSSAVSVRSPIVVRPVALAAPTQVSGSDTLVLRGWGVVGSSPFKLHSWLLGNATAGNMTVSAPTAAVVSQTGTISISTSGLGPATRYLGSVAYSGTTGMPAPTIVRIDTP